MPSVDGATVVDFWVDRSAPGELFPILSNDLDPAEYRQAIDVVKSSLREAGAR